MITKTGQEPVLWRDPYHVADDGLGFPNSPLPLLVYRAALTPDPAAMVRAFAEQGWSNSWHDGIFGYHHFHSIAHELLGITSGEVHVVFGGPSGSRVAVRAGDAVVIPAGVAHFNAGQSPDLLVVGAYPGGSNYDVRRGNPAEREIAMRAIAAAPLPDNDPVLGQAGDLRRLWTKLSSRPLLAAGMQSRTPRRALIPFGMHCFLQKVGVLTSM